MYVAFKERGRPDGQDLVLSIVDASISIFFIKKVLLSVIKKPVSFLMVKMDIL